MSGEQCGGRIRKDFCRGVLESRLLSGVTGLVHGFTLRTAGDAAAAEFEASLLAATGARWVRWLRQVHGVDVARPNDPNERPEADAWAGVCDPGTLLGVRTADCLPVLLCHPRSGVLGAAHAGWRGAAAGVVRNTLKAMDVPADEVMAALGPAIGPCCYQVGGDVARAVGPKCPHLTPWDGVPATYRLDLPALVRCQLEGAGVAPTHIETLALCTACHVDRLFSYRGEGKTGRLCAFVGWAGEGAGP